MPIRMLRFVSIAARPWTMLQDIEAACYPADDSWNHYTLRMAPLLHGRLSELALRGDEPVASCVVGRCDDGNDAWLLGLSVIPGQRGQGTGAQLLDRAIGRCEQAGLARLLLTVSPKNELAAAMYTRRGFVEVDRDDGFYGPGRGRIVMARSI